MKFDKIVNEILNSPQSDSNMSSAMNTKYKPVKNITLPKNIVKLIVDNGFEASLDNHELWSDCVAEMLRHYFEILAGREEDRLDRLEHDQLKRE